MWKHPAYAIAIAFLLMGCVSAQQNALDQTPMRQYQPPASTGYVDEALPKSDIPEARCASLTGDLAPLSKLCNFARTYQQSLPDYLCEMQVQQQLIPQSAKPKKKFKVEPKPQEVDRIKAEFRTIRGVEQLEHITKNGMSISERDITESGLWFGGAFSNQLHAVFAPAATHFSALGIRAENGRSVQVFRFSVEAKDNTVVGISQPGHRYFPAFSGELWLDPTTSNVLHIEIREDEIDGSVASNVRSSTEFGEFVLGEAGRFILPEHSEYNFCFKDVSLCSQNTQQFTGCRKFAAKARVLH